MPKKSKLIIVPIVPELSMGNTSPESSKPKINPAIRWCFTLNNYTDEDIKMFNLICANCAKYWAFSKEVGKEGTPHLQGYIEFKKKHRPKEIFDNERIHWEPSVVKKDAMKANFNYIKKEGGEMWINGQYFKPIIESHNLRPWQQMVFNLAMTEPDPRQINWIWEPKGNTGKSWLCKYLCLKADAIMISNKGSDMKNMILNYIDKKCGYPRLILIDIPRSVDDVYISYSGIEEIKNGCFFSSKYEGGQVLMPSPHIFIFSNKAPDKDVFSNDRWNIIKL